MSSVPSSSTISGSSTATDNIRVLLMASVRNEFGDSCIFSRLGQTALGQHYVLLAKKRFLSGYQTFMITANMRNRPFISAPFKISGIQSMDESRVFIERMIHELGRPGMFGLDEQPVGCQIPIGKEFLQLDEVPIEVHDKPDKYLKRGDEIFCEINVTGIKFFHTGIYAGNGEVYHFVCDPQESETLAEALAVFSGVQAHVCFDSWNEFVYALIEPGFSAPRIFRASHPLVCRSEDQIIKAAENLQETLFVYDIRRSNCQHFTSTCSTGSGFSYDMTSGLKYFACSVMKPTHTVVSAMTRTNKDRSSNSSFASSNS
ncbi:unnamed protein product [Caenorhabditis angaria]|uniref:LRAT domain-containing protein n=1 Tax=Caenorhabditis angaria TaxID=860376 RepID=A0A9P1I9M9_9PELO|nr:unnamed protein product [Caenorhabditis angaria]